MIRIENAKTVTGERITLSLPNAQHKIIDASELLLLPGLIDPHVHFRTPGMEYKEDWCTAAEAAVNGGYTMVFDMPNTLPPTTTVETLRAKKKIIEEQLKKINIPLRYELYFGADKNHLNEISKVKHDVIGIKVFMGCSTGNLVIDDDESLAAVFEIAAKNKMLVAVHAEDEHMLNARKKQFSDRTDYSVHSEIRNTEVAACAVEKAITLSKKYHTKLYILHVSSEAEISLIKAAKEADLPVYAETTPHHLFLNNTFYETLKGKAVMNPPLRTVDDQSALFTAIHEGVIDTIGSDHAPHTVDEKSKPYGQCPCGVPGIETTLPLLLNAVNNGLLSIEEVVRLTSTNARKIFGLAETDDWTLVDLEKINKVDEKKLKTKCHWSPFSGEILRGWPVYVILNGRCFELS